MQRAILLAALALGIAVDGFFALINFYPVAPRPSPGPTRYVIAELSPAQASWFQANVLDVFNDEHNVDIHLHAVDQVEQILPALAAARAQGQDVLLVALPADQGPDAIARKLVEPFTDVVPADQISADLAGVRPRLVKASEIDGHPYFLPRMALLDVLAYRRSKVRDAIDNWRLLRPEIEQALAAWNGRGLPTGYDLELSPGQWDSYDELVLGYYWAHRRYGNRPAAPRIAHRTGVDIDGEIDIAAGLYRFGATDATLGETTALAPRDYFLWEAARRDAGIYDPAMYGAKPFDDEAALAALRRGDVYFTTVDQMEAFELHGGSFRGARPGLPDPSDIGFAPVPAVASIGLDRDGQPALSRSSFSFREDWLWALPAGTPSGKLAYELARFTLTPAIHARECEALGALPIVEDVINRRASIFRVDWMNDIFEAGLDQWETGEEPIPAALAEKGYGATYATLWQAIVARGGYQSPGAARGAIAALLANPTAAKGVASQPPASQIAASEPASAPAQGFATDSDDWRGQVVLEGVAGALVGGEARPAATVKPAPATPSTGRAKSGGRR